MKFLYELEELRWEIDHSTDNMTIKCKRARVLETLKANRAKQVELQTKAAAKWKEQFVERLQATLVAIQGGVGIPEDVKDIIKDLERPSNAIKAYDDAIMMYEWEEREDIELDGTQFKQFIQDDWTWKREWTMSNSKYLA